MADRDGDEMQHEQLIRDILDDRREIDAFHAFVAGAKVAFQHDGTFKNRDDAEQWLQSEWDNFRERTDE